MSSITEFGFMPDPILYRILIGRRVVINRPLLKMDNRKLRKLSRPCYRRVDARRHEAKDMHRLGDIF